MCRSDHGNSIARVAQLCGRRWSGTWEFSSRGHALRPTPKDRPMIGATQAASAGAGVRDRGGFGRTPTSPGRIRRSGQKPYGFWPLLLRVLWRCPTLPQPIGCSTIGAAGLSFQVRNGDWAFPRCYDHHKSCVFNTLPLFCVGGGCGLIVVCIVVAAVLLTVVLSPGCWVLFSVGPLVPVGSRAHCCASTSGLSTR